MGWAANIFVGNMIALSTIYTSSHVAVTRKSSSFLYSIKYIFFVKMEKEKL